GTAAPFISVEQAAVRRTRGAHAGNGRGSIDDGTPVVGQRPSLTASQPGLRPNEQHMMTVESGVCRLKAVETSHEESRGNENDERERDLPDDEQPTEAPPFTMRRRCRAA